MTFNPYAQQAQRNRFNPQQGQAGAMKPQANAPQQVMAPPPPPPPPSFQGQNARAGSSPQMLPGTAPVQQSAQPLAPPPPSSPSGTTLGGPALAGAGRNTLPGLNPPMTKLGEFNLDNQFAQLLAQQKEGLADTMTGIDRNTSLDLRRQANMNAELGRGMGGGFSGGMGQVQLGAMDQKRMAEQDSYKQGLEMKMAYIDRALRSEEAQKDRNLQMELQKQADKTALEIAGLQFSGTPPPEDPNAGGGGNELGSGMKTEDMAAREAGGGALGYMANQAANQYGSLAQGPGGQLLAAGPLAPVAGLAAFGSLYDDTAAAKAGKGDFYNAGGQMAENFGESVKSNVKKGRKKVKKHLGF